MDVILITATFNDLVHGTFNDKKTGCGINLQKPENATKFRRGSRMTALAEITCDKCKARIARELIKADEKEMKAMLKEEKRRAKLGLDDEGIVPLGNTTARITGEATREAEEKEAQKQARRHPAPPAPPEPAYKEPVYEEPAPAPEPEPVSQNPAVDDTLAQFSIPKPVAEPEPEPEDNVDDFLAQFAIPTPVPEPEQQQQTSGELDDFLAQFAIPTPAQQSEPEPAPAPEPDIMEMFSINAAQEAAPEPTAYEPEPAPQPEYTQPPVYEVPQPEPVYQQPTAPAPAEPQTMSNWDDIANQLFGAPAAPSQPAYQQPAAPQPAYQQPVAPQPVYQKPAAPEVPPVLDDISAALEAAQNINTPPVQQPVLEDIAPAPAPVQEAPAPLEMDDLPGLDNFTVPSAARNTVPELEDLAIPELPAMGDTAPEPENYQEYTGEEPEYEEYDEAEDEEYTEEEYDEEEYAEDEYAEEEYDEEEEYSEEEYAEEEPAAPVFDDISAAASALAGNINAPKFPAAPVAPAPVQVNPAPVMPQPVMQQPVQQPTGQIVSVPQLTGYDANNQPVYNYIQMQLTGYDQNGQPMLAPLPNQQMTQPMMQPAMISPQPMMTQPMMQPGMIQPGMLNQGMVTQSMMTQPMIQPGMINQGMLGQGMMISPMSQQPEKLTIGQRIAAAEAAKGARPASANISKIAVNPHSRSTSQAFINAISVSKDHKDESLTDTQGIHAGVVSDSIEDALSALGDNSMKKQRQQQEQAKRNAPSYQEYQAPTRPAPARRPASSSSSSMPDRPLTKAELKAKKKQDKIDAKFRKDMEKRGLK